MERRKGKKEATEIQNNSDDKQQAEKVKKNGKRRITIVRLL